VLGCHQGGAPAAGVAIGRRWCSSQLRGHGKPAKLGCDTVQLVTVRAGRDRRQAERPDQVASGFAHDRQLRNLQRRHVQIPARREHAFGNINHHIR